MGEEGLVVGLQPFDRRLNGAYVSEELTEESELDEVEILVFVEFDSEDDLLLDVHEQHLQQLNQPDNQDAVQL